MGRELLIDALEMGSAELKELEEALHKMNAMYRDFYDKQLREEIKAQSEMVKNKKLEIGNRISRNMEELRFLKSDFKDLFNVFFEDKQLHSILLHKMWLTEFRPLKKEDAEKELKSIRAKRHELREASGFLKKWVGRIDSKSLRATWKVLDGEFTSDMDKDEALDKLKRIDAKYRRKGWLVMLNEPFINMALQKFCKKLDQINSKEFDARKDFEKSKGKGTTTEYNAMKVLHAIAQKKKSMENKCINLVLANPEFARKLKKMSTGPVVQKGMRGIISLFRDIDVRFDQKEWKAEMKKRIGG
ncbi:MAG: hypothetical protein ABII22_00120 [Candidatus Micrarchaeota archaeon]